MLGLLLGCWCHVLDLAWDVLHDHQDIFRRYEAIVIEVKSLRVNEKSLHFESQREQIFIRARQDLGEIF